MNRLQTVTPQILERHSIRVYEPFSDFLTGGDEEKNFEITLLDVVRFAGHACPSMVGAFLIAKRAVSELFPEDVCVRGEISVDIPFPATAGATGPIANVFSFITGAWGETGFGGLRGEFKRRDLLKFGSSSVPEGAFRFTRLSTGKSVDIFYKPGSVNVALDPSLPFQIQWRQRIFAILNDPAACISVVSVNEPEAT